MLLNLQLREHLSHSKTVTTISLRSFFFNPILCGPNEAFISKRAVGFKHPPMVSAVKSGQQGDALI